MQVNTPAATLVYKLVQTLALPAPGSAEAGANSKGGTCVLDICCGTGTIGLVLAPHATRVVGIDNSLQNIGSAKGNAVANGAENVSFVHGAAEKTIDEVLQGDAVASASEIVAVVDPPRGGAAPVFYNPAGLFHLTSNK